MLRKTHLTCLCTPNPPAPFPHRHRHLIQPASAGAGRMSRCLRHSQPFPGPSPQVRRGLANLPWRIARFGPLDKPYRFMGAWHRIMGAAGGQSVRAMSWLSPGRKEREPHCLQPCATAEHEPPPQPESQGVDPSVVSGSQRPPPAEQPPFLARQMSSAAWADVMMRSPLQSHDRRSHPVHVAAGCFHPLRDAELTPPITS